MGKRKLTNEEITEIREMRERGVSVRRTAYYFGVTRGTIRYHTEPELKDAMRARARKRQQELRKKEKGNG